ncbi:MAG: zeta toxin family protein, partial [Verrucomicrobiota bacterium]
STFIREYLEHFDLRYLCADEVAFELNSENPESVAGAAGRIFLQRIRQACEDGEDVIVESTLAGKSFKRTVQRFKDAGYHIVMTFVTHWMLKRMFAEWL